MFGKIVKKNILGLFVLFLLGCQQESFSKQTNLVIFNDQAGIAFAIEGEKLDKIGEVFKLKGEKAPRWDYVVDTEKAVYGKTTEDGSSGFPLIYRYDKADHFFTTIDDGDAYTMSFDGKYLYRTEVYTDRVVFYKHDENLKEVTQKEFASNGTLEITNDILANNDNLYVLVGSMDKEGGQLSNRLWILDKDLNKLEEVDIDYTAENRGGYLHMVNSGNIFYIAVPNSGRQANGEPGPGNTIVTYNLDSKELGQIQVETPYPYELFFDKERNILVIYHYTLYVEDGKWTFIDLDDGSQRTISLAKGYDQDASFTQHNGDYYFLFKEKLVKYNYDEDRKTEYDLGRYGIESASVLVFKK